MFGRIAWTGLLGILTLLPTGCAYWKPPAALPEPTWKGLIGDSFAPDPNGDLVSLTVVVEPAPELPAVGPIPLTRAECQARACRCGRLDGCSVQALWLDHKVAELNTVPPGSLYTLDELRDNIGLGFAARVAQAGVKTASLQYRKRLDDLALAVDRACWTLQSALQTEAVLAARNAPADVRVEAANAAEEARIRLGTLLGLTPEQTTRLVLTDFSLPLLPDDLESALARVPDQHPDLAIVRLHEEIMRETRHGGKGDKVVEHRQRWLRSQQEISDTLARLTDRGAELLRRWHQAQRLLAARRLPREGLTPTEQIQAILAERSSELEVGLAQIDLAHWLKQSACP